MSSQLSFLNIPLQAEKPLPRLNDDGFSIKGCTIIYAPQGQAGCFQAVGDGFEVALAVFAWVALVGFEVGQITLHR